MNTSYNGHSRKSGIYQIKNLNNGKAYIGSTFCFKIRYKQHLDSLRKGTHHSKYLQASFNKHGSDAFVFEVLEVVEGDTAQRRLVEQAHISKYENDWESCYNIRKQTVKKQGPWSNTPLETSKKHSESAKKMWLCEKHRKNMSKKCSEAAKKQWKNPETREVILESVQNASKKRVGVSWGSHTEESRQKIAKAHTGMSEPYMGKKMSKEHIEKCTSHLQSMVHSDKRLTELRKSLCKKVIAFKAETCIEFDSITEAAEYFNISRSTVRRCIKTQKKARAIHWFFAN